MGRRAIPVIVLVVLFSACSPSAGINLPKPHPTIVDQPAASPTTVPPSLIPPPVSIPSAQVNGPRRPRGIYSEIHIDLQADQQQKLNPSITAAEIHAYLRKLYSSQLENPALSGLALGIDWRRLNPSAPPGPQAYDWSYMEDAFSSLADWNAAHPSQPPKTLQVQISAGFGTPQWLLDRIPSCDGLFQSPPQMPEAHCGKATFTHFVEGGGGVLPLPWNAVYKKAFRIFLKAFAEKYGANPLLVSMDVSGPTAASTEMILPNNLNTPAQSQFGNITPNDMWLHLLAFAYPQKPSYQRSDQAFIDEWDQAIDLFGETFSGLTLVATTGSGLPNLADTGFDLPAAFKEDCPDPDMDCAAEATILSHFADPSVDPADAKATESAGMKGILRTGTFNLGVHGAAWLSQTTAKLSAPSAQILGGEQFATSAALYPVQEGCTSLFPPRPKVGTSTSVDPSALPVTEVPADCLAPGITPGELATFNQFSDLPAQDLISPEQAINNVLHNFFDGTPAAASFGGAPGSAPYNYLQIYSQDVKYASEHANTPSQVVRADGTTALLSAQDLLSLASQKLLDMSEPKLTP